MIMNMNIMKNWGKELGKNLNIEWLNVQRNQNLYFNQDAWPTISAWNGFVGINVRIK